MVIGNKDFEIGNKTYMIGIVNVTPDSFFDGGKYNYVDNAVEHTLQLINDGADIIEVGGESARPGAIPIDLDTELERVIPAIEAIRKFTDIPISVDTCKSEVAEQAINVGASIINDFSCFLKDNRMAMVCAEHNVTCCIMHNRNNTTYENFLVDVMDDLKISVERVMRSGVKSENIILDPGIGFAKTDELNLEIMRNLYYFSTLKYPIMLGASRKSFIGNTLNLPVNERLEATIATSVIGVLSGCDFIRVHDVKENRKACDMADKIIRRR